MPLTRTSTDRTRSPRVSRICFSILRLIAASPSGSERSAAFSFWRAAGVELLGSPRRSPGVAGRTGRVFLGMAAAMGEDDRKPPVNLRMNRWVWASRRLEHCQVAGAPVTPAAATESGRSGRRARAAVHPRAARSSLESVGRAVRAGCGSSVAPSPRRTESFPAMGPRATARFRAVGSPNCRRTASLWARTGETSPGAASWESSRRGSPASAGPENLGKREGSRAWEKQRRRVVLPAVSRQASWASRPVFGALGEALRASRLLIRRQGPQGQADPERRPNRPSKERALESRRTTRVASSVCLVYRWGGSTHRR